MTNITSGIVKFAVATAFVFGISIGSGTGHASPSTSISASTFESQSELVELAHHHNRGGFRGHSGPGCIYPPPPRDDFRNRDRDRFHLPPRPHY